MKERPILFNGAMVRAILSGAKTQTRRVMKNQPQKVVVPGIGPMAAIKKAKGLNRWLWPNARDQVIAECPFGQPGDRLWVRETWADVNTDAGPAFTYRADGGLKWCSDEAFPVQYERYPGMDFAMWCSDLWADHPGHRWRPSIHMPRWACRLVLEITAVRAERLQAITEADAIAEGAPARVDPSELRWQHYVPHSRGFIELWNSTGGDWDSNPWVWVIEFKRIEA